jgi:TetR/AcrR family transcriptional regulator, mexJK operon transcriptional repressor
MSTTDRPPVRQGQAHKRAAILAAARDLFVGTGVDRTSMDAVAARAGVSKRTVYDYYGDKHGLLLGVVEAAGEGAVATLRELVDRHLAAADPAEGADAVDRAVTGFATELGATLLLSSDYVAAVRLVRENEPLLPELDDHPLDEEHGRVLAEGLAALARAGLLEADDPDLAAAHLQALTTLRVLNEPAPRRADAEHVRQVMADGARAFLRAYAPRAGVGS